MTQLLAEDCRSRGKCTPAEMEILRTTYLDDYSRILTETSPAFWYRVAEYWKRKEAAKESDPAKATPLRALAEQWAKQISVLDALPPIPSVEMEAQPEGISQIER